MSGCSWSAWSASAGGGDPSTTRHGLAVFERAGDRWQGISVLLPTVGHELGGWRMDGDLLAVEWVEAGGRVPPPQTYRWTGTVLEPTSG